MDSRFSVIQNDRQRGKTYHLMTLIHEAILRNETVMVVFPDLNYLDWWTREWRSRFHIEVPRYITIQNRLNLRGTRSDRVYVEDVHLYPDGIYDERLQEIDQLQPEEIVFTSTREPLPEPRFVPLPQINKVRKSLVDKFFEGFFTGER